MRFNHYSPGDWNAKCDRCGQTFRGSMLRKTWQGLWVCLKDWEPRHPQDFVKSVPERPTPPFVRNPADIFISSCSLNSRSAIPGRAGPGCSIPGSAYIGDPDVLFPN